VLLISDWEEETVIEAVGDVEIGRDAQMPRTEVE